MKELRFQLFTLLWWVPLCGGSLWVIDHWHIDSLAAYFIGGAVAILVTGFDRIARVGCEAAIEDYKRGGRLNE